MEERLKITEGMVSTERLRLYHLQVIKPNAPKLLILGGSNFDLRLKRSFLNTSLVKHCAIATYEPRGIGRSQQPCGNWTMQDYAEDAIAFLDAIGWDEVVVLGESFGGMTALHLALLAPHRIKALIIASATAGGAHASFDISAFLGLSHEETAIQSLCLQDTRNRQLRENRPMRFAAQVKNRIAFEKAFFDPSVINGGYARLLAARRDHDCTAQLGQINIPTTVIAGRYDQQASLENQEALADALNNAEFFAYDDGHGLLFNYPEAVDTALRAILDTGATQQSVNQR